jgi:hypothetical protein
MGAVVDGRCRRFQWARRLRIVAYSFLGPGKLLTDHSLLSRTVSNDERLIIVGKVRHECHILHVIDNKGQRTCYEQTKRLSADAV